MAITTNKILLKDVNGNILLPITRSVFAEISSAAKTMFSYVDTNDNQHIIDNVDDALTYLHDWQDRQDGKLNNLITAINDELPGAFTAYNIKFDNSQYNDPTSPLYNGSGEAPAYFNTGYVQGALESIESKLATTLDNVADLMNTAGVTDAAGSYAISVTGTETGENGEQKGSLTVSLNLADNTLEQDANGLKVSYISASQVNVTKGSGDAITTETLDETIAYINQRLSGAATEGNIELLDGRVTTVEGKVNTLEDQIDNIGITKSSYSGDYAAVYTFTSYDGTQTQINIPKDQFLQSAEYVETAPQDATEQEAAQYPAIVFTWVLDNDNNSPSPTQAKTIIPVADLIASADTKADQALEVLGVERDNEDHIVVPNGASSAISGKETVEDQIQGLDSALQGIQTTAESALQGVNFNGNNVTVTDNIAYVTADGSDINVSYITTYSADPGAITVGDSMDTAISKILYNESALDAKIKLDYIDGGSSYVEPITNGFAGINYTE